MIDAPIERCFDLSRSIDLHITSTEHTNEKAVAGVTTGLINLNESVTWEARHFGITQKMTTRISRFERPEYFLDVMEEGAFNSLEHRHEFQKIEGQTLMTDIFDFISPMGILGRLFDKLILTRYMTNLLEKRNSVIKEFAETKKWKDCL